MTMAPGNIQSYQTIPLTCFQDPWDISYKHAPIVYTAESVFFQI